MPSNITQRISQIPVDDSPLKTTDAVTSTDGGAAGQAPAQSFADLLTPANISIRDVVNFGPEFTGAGSISNPLGVTLSVSNGDFVNLAGLQFTKIGDLNARHLPITTKELYRDYVINSYSGAYHAVADIAENGSLSIMLPGDNVGNPAPPIMAIAGDFNRTGDTSTVQLIQKAVKPNLLAMGATQQLVDSLAGFTFEGIIGKTQTAGIYVYKSSTQPVTRRYLSIINPASCLNVSEGFDCVEINVSTLTIDEQTSSSAVGFGGLSSGSCVHFVSPYASVIGVLYPKGESGIAFSLKRLDRTTGNLTTMTCEVFQGYNTAQTNVSEVVVSQQLIGGASDNSDINSNGLSVTTAFLSRQNGLIKGYISGFQNLDKILTGLQQSGGTDFNDFENYILIRRECKITSQTVADSKLFTGDLVFKLTLNGLNSTYRLLMQGTSSVKPSLTIIGGNLTINDQLSLPRKFTLETDNVSEYPTILSDGSVFVAPVDPSASIEPKVYVFKAIGNQLDNLAIFHVTLPVRTQVNLSECKDILVQPGYITNGTGSTAHGARVIYISSRIRCFMNGVVSFIEPTRIDVTDAVNATPGTLVQYIPNTPSTYWNKSYRILYLYVQQNGNTMTWNISFTFIPESINNTCVARFYYSIETNTVITVAEAYSRLGACRLDTVPRDSSVQASVGLSRSFTAYTRL